MEKGEVLTIVFTLLTSLLTSLVGSSVLTAFLNRRWAQSNKANSILEEQYLKVISPIYRELQLNCNSKEKMISNIEKIISENFHLLPEQLLKKFKNINKNEYEFKMLIFDFYALLRNELGYSKTKVSKAVKEREKLLAEKDNIFSYKKQLYPTVIVTIISMFSFFIIQAQDFFDYFTANSINVKTLLLILTCLFMFLHLVLITILRPKHK